MTDLDAFDYELPDDAIAQHPAEPRESARLLVDRGPAQAVEHRVASDLPELIREGDVVVVNDSRVLPARLHLLRSTGGAIEVLLLDPIDGARWHALARPARRLRAGEPLWAEGEDDPVLRFDRRVDDGRVEVTVLGHESAEALLARHGSIPLPPYVTTTLADAERYQTVYARNPGSVAAPTAGLHLSHDVLDRCRDNGAVITTIELSVGIGTFRPILVDRVEDHEMHHERYRVPPETIAALANARSVLAVGTTTVRTLESWAITGRSEGSTNLFIHGDHEFQVVDRLLTNFHVPRSSLLVMIDAFVGSRWRSLYDLALAEGYRFLSFGDAMLLERTPSPTSRTGAP